MEDRHNLGATEMQRAVETLMEHYHNYPALASVSSQYQANVPQYFLNIDRDKAIAFEPFLPFSSEKLRKMLNMDSFD